MALWRYSDNLCENNKDKCKYIPRNFILLLSMSKIFIYKWNVKKLKKLKEKNNIKLEQQTPTIELQSNTSSCTTQVSSRGNSTIWYLINFVYIIENNNVIQYLLPLTGSWKNSQESLAPRLIKVPISVTDKEKTYMKIKWKKFKNSKHQVK